MFEVTGHSRLEFPELIGHHIVRQGNMEFEYGPLALAMKFGGLFLLNEIDLLEPSTAAWPNSILDGQPLCIPENGGELIVPHPMFRFAATANSNGGSTLVMLQGLVVLLQNPKALLEHGRKMLDGQAQAQDVLTALTLHSDISEGVDLSANDVDGFDEPQFETAKPLFDDVPLAPILESHGLW